MLCSVIKPLISEKHKQSKRVFLKRVIIDCLVHASKSEADNTNLNREPMRRYIASAMSIIQGICQTRFPSVIPEAVRTNEAQSRFFLERLLNTWEWDESLPTLM